MSFDFSRAFYPHISAAKLVLETSIGAFGNRRIRYYWEIQPAQKAGEMAGRRYVHKFDGDSRVSRGWHETVDLSGNVRQVRPELNNGIKTHYRIDANGNYLGKW